MSNKRNEIAPTWNNFSLISDEDSLAMVEKFKEARTLMGTLKGFLNVGLQILNKIKPFIQILALIEAFAKDFLTAILKIITATIDGIINNAASTGIYFLDLTSYHITPKKRELRDLDLHAIYEKYLKNDIASAELDAHIKDLLAGKEDTSVFTDTVNFFRGYKKETYIEFINRIVEAFMDENDKPSTEIYYRWRNNVALLGQDVLDQIKNGQRSGFEVGYQALKDLYTFDGIGPDDALFRFRVESYIYKNYKIALDALIKQYKEAMQAEIDSKLREIKAQYKEQGKGIGSEEFVDSQYGPYKIPFPSYFRSGRPRFDNNADVRVYIIAFAFPDTTAIFNFMETIKPFIKSFVKFPSYPAFQVDASGVQTNKQTLNKTTFDKLFGDMSVASIYPGAKAIQENYSDKPSDREPNFVGITAEQIPFMAPIFAKLRSLNDDLKKLARLSKLKLNYTEYILKTIQGIEEKIRWLGDLLDKIDDFLAFIESLLLLSGFRILDIQSSTGTMGIIKQLKNAQGFYKETDQPDPEPEGVIFNAKDAAHGRMDSFIDDQVWKHNVEYERKIMGPDTKACYGGFLFCYGYPKWAAGDKFNFAQLIEDEYDKQLNQWESISQYIDLSNWFGGEADVTADATQVIKDAEKYGTPLEDHYEERTNNPILSAGGTLQVFPQITIDLLNSTPANIRKGAIDNDGFVDGFKTLLMSDEGKASIAKMIYKVRDKTLRRFNGIYGIKYYYKVNDETRIGLIEIDSQLPVDASGDLVYGHDPADKTKAFWFPYIEKAMASLDTTNGYSSLTSYTQSDIIFMVTGRTGEDKNLPSVVKENSIYGLLSRGVTNHVVDVILSESNFEQPQTITETDLKEVFNTVIQNNDTLTELYPDIQVEIAGDTATGKTLDVILNESIEYTTENMNPDRINASTSLAQYLTAEQIAELLAYDMNELKYILPFFLGNIFVDTVAASDLDATIKAEIAALDGTNRTITTTNGYQELGLSDVTYFAETGLSANTKYYFDININSAGIETYHITTSVVTNYNALINSLNDALEGKAEFELIKGDLRCRLLYGGNTSNFELSSSTQTPDLFTNLTGFTTFDSAVDGVDSTLRNESVLEIFKDTVTATNYEKLRANVEGTIDLSNGLNFADIPEIRTVQCVADSDGSLSEKYWWLFDQSNSYYVWYDVTGMGDATESYQEWGMSGITGSTSTGLSTTTRYYFQMITDGSVLTEYDFMTAGDVTYDAVLILMNTAIVSTGATFAIVGGDIRCTSGTTGVSSIIIHLDGETSPPLFAAISGFTSFDNTVPGVDAVTSVDPDPDVPNDMPASKTGIQITIAKDATKNAVATATHDATYTGFTKSINTDTITLRNNTAGIVDHAIPGGTEFDIIITQYSEDNSSQTMTLDDGTNNSLVTFDSNYGDRDAIKTVITDAITFDSLTLEAYDIDNGGLRRIGIRQTSYGDDYSFIVTDTSGAAATIGLAEGTFTGTTTYPDITSSVKTDITNNTETSVDECIDTVIKKQFEEGVDGSTIIPEDMQASIIASSLTDLTDLSERVTRVKFNELVAASTDPVITQEVEDTMLSTTTFNLDDLVLDTANTIKVKRINAAPQLVADIRSEIRGLDFSDANSVPESAMASFELEAYNEIRTEWNNIYEALKKVQNERNSLIGDVALSEITTELDLYIDNNDDLTEQLESSRNTIASPYLTSLDIIIEDVLPIEKEINLIIGDVKKVNISLIDIKTENDNIIQYVTDSLIIQRRVVYAQLRSIAVQRDAAIIELVDESKDDGEAHGDENIYYNEPYTFISAFTSSEIITDPYDISDDITNYRYIVLHSNKVTTSLDETAINEIDKDRYIPDLNFSTYKGIFKIKIEDFCKYNFTTTEI